MGRIVDTIEKSVRLDRDEFNRILAEKARDAINDGFISEEESKKWAEKMQARYENGDFDAHISLNLVINEKS